MRTPIRTPTVIPANAGIQWTHTNRYLFPGSHDPFPAASFASFSHV